MDGPAKPLPRYRATRLRHEAPDDGRVATGTPDRLERKHPLTFDPFVVDGRPHARAYGAKATLAFERD